MESGYKTSYVLSNEKVSEGIYRLEVESDFSPAAGQFFMVRAWEKTPLLSRPISVNDATDKTIVFLYQVKGEGTKILSELKPKDEVKLLGPLGHGFPVEELKGRIAIVGGGIGTAPLLYTLKSLKNCKTDVYLGFRDKSYGTSEFEKYAEELHIATETGAEGHKGYVTDIFDAGKYDTVLTCGPEIMMKAVARLCAKSGTPLYVSLEEHMACGVGACLVCSCKTKYGNKRVCKDGPVFKAEEVMQDA